MRARNPESARKIAEATEKKTGFKRAAGVRDRSLIQLRSSLRRFSKAVNGTKLHDITLEHLTAYVARNDWSRKTQNNVRADLHAFFEWCRAKPRQWVYENPAHEYRTIDIQPNLAAWLAPYAKTRAPIVGRNFDRDCKAVRAAFDLGHDVMRHSFISSHVARFKSVGGTAHQAGNSEAIVRRHYLKMVSMAEAKEFWAIRPAG